MTRILLGDVLARLAQLPPASVHCVVTSPPYWGLRDYGIAGQLGLERTPAAYVEKMVEVFRGVRRVLRDDGTLWLNMGDAYAGSGFPGGHASKPGTLVHRGDGPPRRVPATDGLKPKDLVGMPWQLAFALRADGWYLRADCIWSKPNPMPESVRDRPTKAHEYMFLLTKSGSPTSWTHRDHGGTRTQPPPDYRWIDQLALSQGRPAEVIYEPPNWRDEKLRNGRPRWRRVNLWAAHDYFYDQEAVRESAQYGRREWKGDLRAVVGQHGHKGSSTVGGKSDDPSAGRNLRSVWAIPTQAFPEAHFATFPEALVLPCIKAGTSEKGCCPDCGAPWRRLIAKTRTFESGSGKSGRDPAGKNGPGLQGGGETGDVRRGPVVHSQTTGWKPGCEHDVAPVPCTVLDPFLGSGTTALVAARLGRDCIGIELKPDGIAERRLAREVPLLASVDVIPAEKSLRGPHIGAKR